MDFSDFIYINELGFLIEAPVLTTKLVGSASKEIDPKTGKSWRVNQKLEQLIKIRDDHPNDSLYVHFSNGVTDSRENAQPKLGVFPGAEDGSTPIGIYAYPIDYVIQDNFRTYATDRLFMLVFKTKKRNILYMNQNDREISNFDEMLSLLSKNKIEEEINKLYKKEVKKLKTIIRKITQDAKKDKIFDENIIDFMFNKIIEEINYQVLIQISDRWISEQQSIININNYILNFTTSYSLMNNFRNYSDPDFYISNYLKRIYGNDFEEKDIDFENLTYKILDNSENPPQLKEKKLLDLFNSSTDRFKSHLVFFIIKKYQNSPFFEKLKKRLEKVVSNSDSLLEKIDKKREEAISEFQFPFKEEFLKITSEFHVNILECLKKLFVQWKSGNFGSSQKNNVGNFVYKFSGIIAKEASNANQNTPRKRKRKYYILWTSILKKIGFEGIVDKENTGGIHSNEKTQAVFFDTRQLQLVAVLKNINKTKTSTVDWNSNDSPHQRWYMGIISSIDKFRIGYFNNEITQTRNLIKMYRDINKILIVLHSYSRFAKKINEENKDADKNFKNLMIHKISHIFIYNKEFDRITYHIKNNIELMKHARKIYSIIEQINNYLRSDDLKATLIQPSLIRTFIFDLTKSDLYNWHVQ